MIALQLSSEYSQFIAITFVCLIFLAALIVMEIIIIAPEKKSLRACKLFTIAVNVAACLAPVVFIFIIRCLNIPPDILNSKFFQIAFYSLPLIIAAVEPFICIRMLKEIRKLKLLGLLLLINISSYYIAFFWLMPAVQLLNRSPRFKPRCASNLKQIGLALKMYAMDYDDHFPDKQGAEGLEQLRSTDYLTDNNVYQCPACDSNMERGKKLTEEDVGYIYRAGFKEGRDDPETPIAWDKPENHKDYGNVLFINGRVKGFPGADWME